MSSEHAQFEHSNQAVIEGLQQEKDNLQSHLQQRLKENEQLTKYVCCVVNNVSKYLMYMYVLSKQRFGTIRVFLDFPR